jgi:hypothetical protein
VIPAIDAVYTWNVTEAVNTVGTSDGVLTLFIRPSVYPADDDYRGPHFYSVEAGISPPVLRISPVPEPLSAAMLLVGLALVVPVARRQVRGG